MHILFSYFLQSSCSTCLTIHLILWKYWFIAVKSKMLCKRQFALSFCRQGSCPLVMPFSQESEHAKFMNLLFNFWQCSSLFWKHFHGKARHDPKVNDSSSSNFCPRQSMANFNCLNFWIFLNPSWLIFYVLIHPFKSDDYSGLLVYETLMHQQHTLSSITPCAISPANFNVLSFF